MVFTSPQLIVIRLFWNGLTLTFLCDVVVTIESDVPMYVYKGDDGINYKNT